MNGRLCNIWTDDYVIYEQFLLSAGVPQPDISWQKDSGSDFPAARERRIHVDPDTNTYVIMNVKADDMGVYTCTATNLAGAITTNITLNVLEVPRKYNFLMFSQSWKLLSKSHSLDWSKYSTILANRNREWYNVPGLWSRCLTNLFKVDSTSFWFKWVHFCHANIKFWQSSILIWSQFNDALFINLWTSFKNKNLISIFFQRMFLHRRAKRAARLVRLRLATTAWSPARTTGWSSPSTRGRGRRSSWTVTPAPAPVLALSRPTRRTRSWGRGGRVVESPPPPSLLLPTPATPPRPSTPPPPSPARRRVTWRASTATTPPSRSWTSPAPTGWPKDCTIWKASENLIFQDTSPKTTILVGQLPRNTARSVKGKKVKSPQKWQKVFNFLDPPTSQDNVDKFEVRKNWKCDENLLNPSLI